MVQNWAEECNGGKKSSSACLLMLLCLKDYISQHVIHKVHEGETKISEEASKTSRLSLTHICNLSFITGPATSKMSHSTFSKPGKKCHRTNYRPAFTIYAIDTQDKAETTVPQPIQRTNESMHFFKAIMTTGKVQGEYRGHLVDTMGTAGEVDCFGL